MSAERTLGGMSNPRRSFELVRVTAVKYVRDHVPELSRFYGIVISTEALEHSILVQRSPIP